MARIAGVDLPREKKIEFALPYIFGIGRHNAQRILAETGVSPVITSYSIHYTKLYDDAVLGAQRGRAMVLQCRRWDSNPHGLAPTAP